MGMDATSKSWNRESGCEGCEVAVEMDGWR